MNAFLNLKPAARAYVALVVALGVLTVWVSVRELYLSPISSQWLILAGLTLQSVKKRAIVASDSLAIAAVYILAIVMYLTV